MTAFFTDRNNNVMGATLTGLTVRGRRTTAFMNANGRLEDAERWDNCGRVVPVKPEHRHLWREIEQHAKPLFEGEAKRRGLL